MSSKDIPTRLQWFYSRIGSKVFRNAVSCFCEMCERVYTEGLEVVDKTHAMWLYEVEGISAYDDRPVKYFDSIEEVQQYEQETKENKYDL